MSAAEELRHDHFRMAARAEGLVRIVLLDSSVKTKEKLMAKSGRGVFIFSLASSASPFNIVWMGVVQDDAVVREEIRVPRVVIQGWECG